MGVEKSQQVRSRSSLEVVSFSISLLSEVPHINKLLMENVPHAIGRLPARESRSAQSLTASMRAFGYPYYGHGPTCQQLD